jgi:transposase
MAMLSETIDAVIGGDTHRDTHALVMLNGQGAKISSIEIDNDSAGFAEALDWISEHAPGPAIAVGLEGSRSYGIGLCRTLIEAGLAVIEAEQPKRSHRRNHGKDDFIDAELAARYVLTLDAGNVPQPRADGDREALRLLLICRRDVVEGRTRKYNILHTVLLTGSDADRAMSKGKFTVAKLNAIKNRRGPKNETREERTRRERAAALAKSILAADREAAELSRQLHAIVAELTPNMLAKTGVGPVTGAQAIVSWSHPGRVRNDAAFASLAGVSPLPASSGRTIRYRLNRGGDRQLNRAADAIARTRWRCDPETIAYVTRRKAEGKSNAEIRRCIKRYIIRELHKDLTAEMVS